MRRGPEGREHNLKDLLGYDSFNTSGETYRRRPGNVLGSARIWPQYQSRRDTLHESHRSQDTDQDEQLCVHFIQRRRHET